MSKLSCNMCIDLMPLVKDEVASEDSKKAVEEHIKTCESCRKLFGEEVVFEDSDSHIIAKIKKNLTRILVIIIALGILFGISLSASSFMFYNVLIMPVIGAVSYFAFKKKSLFLCLAIFIIVYLRWVYDSIGYVIEGSLVQAFLPPLFWALIYLGLTVLGVVIAFLLCFGFGKEKLDEKNI